MLNSYNDLKSYSIRATDERTGNVDDIYFDDQSWKIRYLVAHTGFLLSGRQSLVGASRLGIPDTDRREMPVDLTAEELTSAETPKADAPVSEQVEPRPAAPGMPVWPSFIVGPGAAYTPEMAQEQLDTAMSDPEEMRPRGDPSLRSMAEVTGYTIHATDGEIGAVDDFLIDPDTWQVQHVVVDTGNWLPGRRVAIATDWITEVDWSGQRIHVDTDTQSIRDAPEIREIGDLQQSAPNSAALASYGALGYWPV